MEGSPQCHQTRPPWGTRPIGAKAREAWQKRVPGLSLRVCRSPPYTEDGTQAQAGSGHRRLTRWQLRQPQGTQKLCDTGSGHGLEDLGSATGRRGAEEWGGGL